MIAISLYNVLHPLGSRCVTYARFGEWHPLATGTCEKVGSKLRYDRQDFPLFLPSHLTIYHSDNREMAPSGIVAIGMLVRELQVSVNQLHYNRMECRQLVDHINAFIASIEEKSDIQDLLLVDLQEKLFK